jgi:hypothetical protein
MTNFLRYAVSNLIDLQKSWACHDWYGREEHRFGAGWGAELGSAMKSYLRITLLGFALMMTGLYGLEAA